MPKLNGCLKMKRDGFSVDFPLIAFDGLEKITHRDLTGGTENNIINADVNEVPVALVGSRHKILHLEHLFIDVKLAAAQTERPAKTKSRSQSLNFLARRQMRAGLQFF